MKIFKQEQINEMRELQRALDARIITSKGLEGVDLSLERYLALKTEIFEFVNELETFKFWKENKGKDHILEEACDALHFILSIQIANNVETDLESLISEGFDPSIYETNESLGIIDAMITDAYVEREWTILNGVLLLMLAVLTKYNFSADDLYNAYIAKNKVNHERQDKQY